MLVDYYPWAEDLPWAQDYKDLKASIIPPALYDHLLRLYPKLRWSCPTCHGKLWKTEDPKTFHLPLEKKKGIVRECDCETQKMLYGRYALANLADIFMRFQWSDYQGTDKQPFQQVQSWLTKHEGYIDGNSMGLGLFGGPGNGKSFFASLVAKELVKLGYSVHYTSFTSMVESYIEGWQDHDARKMFQARVLQAPILVIDGISSPRAKPFGDALRYVIEERCPYGRPIIFTTDLMDARLTNEYGGEFKTLLSSVLFQVLKGSDYRDTHRLERLRYSKEGWVRQVY